MGYRVIFLDGLDGRPFVECVVCKELERNVIEPVAIFVKEEDFEKIKGELRNLPEDKVDEVVGKLIKETNKLLRQSESRCIFHCEKENEVWIENIEEYREYRQRQKEAIAKEQPFNEDSPAKWRQNLVDIFWERIRAYRFAVDYAEGKWTDEARKILEENKDLLKFYMEGCKGKVYYDFRQIVFPAFQKEIGWGDLRNVVVIKEKKNNKTKYHLKYLENLNFWYQNEIKQFSGEWANFGGARFFSGGTNFREAQFSGRVDFLGAQFSGEAYFSKTQFSGEANFWGAQFSGKADFGGAQFSGEANFSGARFFSGGANFWEAQFSGEANFSGARFFSGGANFAESQFSGEAYFGYAQFSGEWANFGGAQFSGKADFGGAQFSGEAYFSGARFFLGGANFGESQFSGEANFSGARFFSGGANFAESQFSGEANFSGARFFSGGANFREAQFSGGANFLGAQFSGEANFGGVQFSGEANFAESQFSGEANFREVQFSGEAYFSKTQFSGEAYFSKTQFSGEAYFLEVRFSGKADFMGAQFKNKTLFIFEDKNKLIDFFYIQCSPDTHIEIRNLKTERLIINNFTNYAKEFLFFDLELLQGENNNEPNLEIKNSILNKIRFINCDFSKGEKIKIEDSSIASCEFVNVKWGKISEKRICPELFKNEPSKAQDIYRQLKLAHDNQKDFIHGGDFYALEMRAYDKYLDSLSWLEHFKDKIVFKISKFASNFAQDWLKPVVWIVTITLYLSLFTLFDIGYSQKFSDFNIQEFIAYMPTVFVLLTYLFLTGVLYEKIGEYSFYKDINLIFSLFSFTSLVFILGVVADKNISEFVYVLSKGFDLFFTSLAKLFVPWRTLANSDSVKVPFYKTVYGLGSIAVSYLAYQLIVSLRRKIRR